MIPFFQISQLHVGPVPINIWGLLVAVGIVLGLIVAAKEAKRQGLAVDKVLDIAFWSVVTALVGARIFFVLTEIGRYVADPVAVFKVWEGGMSITGGFIGAVLAAWFYMKKHKLPFFEYTDVAIFGLPVGLWIGRLGCTLIIDHPGTPTSFFLGQEYIDGIVRHNHGLYLSINGFFMAAAFFLLWKIRPNRTPGFYASIFLMWYGTARFALDFFRAYDLPGYTDSRLLGLTGAQYVGVAMIVLGGLLWYRVKHKMTESSNHA